MISKELFEEISQTKETCASQFPVNLQAFLVCGINRPVGLLFLKAV
jgi:hypothetical protein